MSTYKDLKVWQKSIELALLVYRVTDLFPSKENFGLTSQMRRCAVSVPSNIAEGKNRRSNPEFKRFINIALGSLGELDTQSLLAKELQYCSEINFKEISKLVEEVGKMLNALKKAI